MIIKLMQPDDCRIVEDFINSETNNTSIYHTFNWQRVIEGTYGYKPYYIVAIKNNSVKGLLPFFQVRGLNGKKRMICLPFSHWVSPVYDTPATLNHMLDYSEYIARKIKAGYIQIKCDLDQAERNS